MREGKARRRGTKHQKQERKRMKTKSKKSKDMPKDDRADTGAKENMCVRVRQEVRQI